MISSGSGAPLTARCACGKVVFEALGAPIVCAACYCEDCQEAARLLEALLGAPLLADPDGGTPMVVFRKDRVKCTQGGELLSAHKLNAGSPTSRMVASCCNSAMILTFDDIKWWTDVYRARVQGNPPPLEMRSCVKFRRGAGALPDDVPNYPGYALRLFAKLLAARFAMFFGA